MFKLNLKIAWRNLWKNKIYTGINVIGLAFGLAAFIMILLYINHEESYDNWSPKLENVYQVREFHAFDSPDNKQYWQVANEGRIAGLLKNHVPQVSQITKIEKEYGDENWAFLVEHQKPIMIKSIRDADSAFFKVLPYQFLAGNSETALDKPNSLVLKQDVAIKLFSTIHVIGKEVKVIRWNADKGLLLTVTGVIANPSLPQNINFNGISHTGKYDKDPDNEAYQTYCEIYAKIDQHVDLKLLNENAQTAYTNRLKQSLAAHKTSWADYLKSGNLPGLKLIPMKEAHKNPPFSANWIEKLKPVVLIAIFLLIISLINFVNLATAQSQQRAKEIGVRKVLGANKQMLIKQFLIEAALQTLAAFFICIVLVELLLPTFHTYFDIQLSFWSNPQIVYVILQLFFLLAIVTILAGFYPARVLANYHPAAVLKGTFSNSLKGMALRNVLVVTQFVISVSFIIGIGVMYTQLNFIANKDLGFDKHKVINISSNYNEVLAQRFRKIPGVEYVGTTTQVMGNTFGMAQEINFSGNKFNINVVTVTMEAFPALGIAALEGRIFSPLYKQDTINTVVVNQSAARIMGKNMVGKTYKMYGDVFQIIGLIKDYHAEGFEKAVLPTIYKVTYLGGMDATNNLLVRFNSENYQLTIRALEREWQKYSPNYPMEYQTLETSFDRILLENNRLMNMILLFSFVSVSLSLLGLFALSTFVAKRRTKEVAVRKVLGASNLQIIHLLNKSFMILVLVANLISWPIAYILIKKWLDGFAYRIDMPFLPFIIATVSSIFIAVLTVSIQARKAATRDPVRALKYE